MSEKTFNTVIEALAETVRSLKLDVLILTGENNRLREKVAMYEQKTQEVGKNNG